MKTGFRLAWLKPGSPPRRAFKSPHLYAQFNEYLSRISRFSPCQAIGTVSAPNDREPGVIRWVCDRLPGARGISSEEIAGELRKIQGLSKGLMEVWIGGADGFSPTDLQALKPDLRWSFGPLTLPHELASVVAAEQIYRGWTILKKLPYHLGH